MYRNATIPSNSVDTLAKDNNFLLFDILHIRLLLLLILLLLLLMLLQLLLLLL